MNEDIKSDSKNLIAFLGSEKYVESKKLKFDLFLTILALFDLSLK